MLGVMDVKDFTQGVSWNMLIVIGVLFGLSNIFGQLGINEFFAKQVSPLTSIFGDRQWLLLIGMAVLIYLMRFFLTAQMAAIPIFVTIFLPLCQAAGISPWICAFVSATSSNVWNVLYQNTFAMQAYAAYDGEENIQYGRIALVSVAYMVINIIAILLNFPIWKMTGLIA
jgi:DASS family divalent anion:Na+ symporter